jgi:hypothetical protein
MKRIGAKQAALFFREALHAVGGVGVELAKRRGEKGV